MALHFNRVGPATAELKIWSASERGRSFVISHKSSRGPGLHGRAWLCSFLASNPYQQACRQGGRIPL